MWNRFPQEASSDGVGTLFERRRRALRDNFTAVYARTRSHVDDEVGRPHGVFVVFDDEHGIAAIAESAK